MSTVLRKLVFSAVAAFAVTFIVPATAGAADLVGGYYPPQEKSYRIKTVRTAYVHREVRDCQMLRIREPDGNRVTEVCFKPIF